MDEIKRDLSEIEKEALLNWIRAQIKLKELMNYIKGEPKKEESIDPETGLYDVDLGEDFWTLDKAWRETIKECDKAQERYIEIKNINKDEL